MVRMESTSFRTCFGFLFSPVFCAAGEKTLPTVSVHLDSASILLGWKPPEKHCAKKKGNLLNFNLNNLS